MQGGILVKNICGSVSGGLRAFGQVNLLADPRANQNIELRDSV